MITNKALKYFGILISLVWGLQISAQNEQNSQAWAGANPESRSGGCAFFTLTPNPSSPTCNGFSDGVASVIPSDGVGPYTYNWIGGPATQTWNNVGAGTYTVIVFDQGQGGVPCNIDVFVNEPGPLTVFAMNAVSPTCFGACNGEAAPVVIGGSGGYSFAWDSGESGFTANQLCNPFTLTITDSQGCVLDTTYTFNNEPDEIIISADTTLISCSGETDGAIDISISGGSPDYSYSWSGSGGFSSTNQNISGLSAGSYVITVTDENNCEATETFEITEPLPLDVVAEVTPNPCGSDTLGSIELTITGGTPDYITLWTGPGGFSSSDQNIAGLVTGTYDLELTDVNGCQLIASYEITAPPAIEITLTPTDISCNGADDGSVAAEVTGGADSFTYEWSGPGGFTSTSLSISVLMEGTYTLTATDSSGCSNSEVVLINEPEALVVDGTVQDIPCAGELNGAVSITVSGGIPDYSFSWTGPDGYTSLDQNISGLMPGDYSVDITDENGCTITEIFTVTEPSPIQINGNIIDNLCAGQSTGSIDLDIAGGTPPYTFNWSGPSGFTSTDEDIANLEQGSYTVEVTDSLNCLQVVEFNIDESNPLVLSLTPSLLTCPADTDGSILLEITGGTPNYDTQWTGPDGFSSSNQNISGLDEGVYAVTVTDANGCESIDATEILAPDTMLPVVTTIPISCSGLSDGAISVSVIGGAPEYSFLWVGPNGFTSLNADIFGLEAGQYDLTITDANGCTTNLTVNLDEPEPIDLSADITDATCNGIFDGAINLSINGGTPPYSVQWSGPGGFTSNNQNISGLNHGNYTALVTDSLGCTINSNFAVGFGEGPQVDAVVTDASCDSNDDGSIEATVSGGTSPYSIFWQGPNGFTANTLSIFNLEAGTYTFFATDAADCFAEINYTVNNPSSIEIDAEITDVLCAGEPTGAIDITLTGVIEPITIAWSGPDGFASADQDIDNLHGGEYTITITDSLGCITQEVFNINAPTALDLSLLVTQPACGLSNGQIIASVSGGTVAGDYNYLWTDQDNNLIGSANQVSGLGSGTYNVTVSDDNGCIVEESVELSETDLEIDATITDLLCNGHTDGAIEVTITGGNPPYTNDWSGPDGFSSADTNISGLIAGNYTLTVTDSLNCQLIETFEVIQPDSIQITQSSENITCAGDNDGSISVSITGGTPPYTTNWGGPDGFTAQDTVLTNLAPGTYTLVLTDDNGCIAATEVTITEEPEITVVENITDIACSGTAEGAIDITISGGNLPLDIAWSGPDGFTSDQADIANLLAGEYTLVITDNNGCVFAESYTVAEVDPIVIDPVINPANCAGDNDASISVTVSGGTPEYSYSWSGPDGFTANTADINNLAPGEYTLVVTDALDCQLEENFSITEPEPLVISTDIVQPECLESNGSITAQVSGGTAPYTYQWEDEDGNILGTNTLLENLAAGLYLITAIDTNSCEISEWITLSNPGGEITAEITNVDCFGESNGSITTEVLNATEPFTYAWSNDSGFSADTPDIFDLEADIYNLVVTDSLGCVYAESFEVNEPDSISLVAEVTGISCFGGDGVIDLNISGGIPPYSLTWTGPDGFTSDTTNISGLSNGTYTATVTDSQGCSAEIVIDLAPLPEIEIDLVATDLSCFDSANGAITTTVNGGQPDYEYTWIGPGGYLSDSASISGLEAGFYEIQVTDANGCVATEGILIDAPEEIEIIVDAINSTCGNNNGSLSVAATGGTVAADYNYTWSDADNVVIATTAGVGNLGPGAYTIVVTDDNGCETSETVAISDADGEITAEIVMPSCFAGNDGSIDITVTGGTEPYSFSWTGPDGFTSSDQNINNLLPGSYVIEVTDNLGCIFVEVFELEIPETVTLALEVTPISCAGFNDGSITLTIDGGLAPYTIEWTGPNGFTSSDTLLTDLEPGFYEVTVTDSLLCSAAADLTLAEPAPITADFDVVDNLCPDDTNGAITVTASGGTAPYEFQWVGPDGFESQGQNLGGLFSGIYDLQITDTLGCTADFQVEISSTPPIVVDLNITSALCYGDSTGTIEANVSGGTPGYDYDWTGPNGFSAQDSAIANLIPGGYQLTVTDFNGCSMMIDTILSQPDSLYAVVELTPISCFGDTNGTIDVTVLGGTSPYSYMWSGPNGFADTTASISDLESGIYQLTYTDSLGCFGEITGEIIEPDSINLSLENVNDAICSNDNSGFIEVSVSGGTSPYSYNWTGPDGYTSEDQNPDSLLPGDYVLELTDENGCSADLEASVDFTLEIDADAGPDSAVCEDEQPIILTGTGTNSTEVWWTDSIGNILSNNDTLSLLQSPGDYTFYFYASNGLCVELDSVSITIYGLPNANAGSNQTIVEGEEVTLGGNPTTDSGNNVLWIPGENLSDSTALNPAGNPEETTSYEVIVTDENGCVNNDFTAVTVVPDIDIPSGISPNGDNYNDAWIIDHIELFPGNVVEVYNRWGDQLFRAEGYDNNEPWDGFYNGVALPIGTYYYVIELNDERFPEPYTGPITIFR